VKSLDVRYGFMQFIADWPVGLYFFNDMLNHSMFSHSPVFSDKPHFVYIIGLQPQRKLARLKSDDIR